MKNNMKSIRMTDEVLELVQGYRGDGFNEKFENLCLDFLKGREKHEAEMKYLNEQIKRKQAEMRQLVGKLYKASEMESRTTALVKVVLEYLEL